VPIIYELIFIHNNDSVCMIGFVVLETAI
jgi:hypothetical protein